MKLKIALALSLLASQAFADARKIDFTQPIRDHHGVAATIPDPEKGKDATKPFTLGMAVAQALLSSAQEDQMRPGTPVSPSSYVMKAKRAQLAIRIENATDVELTTEEITRIKEAAGAVYPPITVLRIVEAVDPAAIK